MPLIRDTALTGPPLSRRAVMAGGAALPFLPTLTSAEALANAMAGAGGSVDSARLIVEITNELTGHLMQSFAQKPDAGNTCISPFGAASALSLIALGASGATQKWLEANLRTSVIDLVDAQAALTATLFGADGPLVSVNSVMVRPDLALTAAFSSAATRGFDAIVSEINFDDPAAIEAINQLISDKTGGRIAGALTALPKDAEVIVANALRFKAKWADAFSRKASVDRPFTALSGEIREVRMMRTERSADYGETASFQIVRLPFADGLFRATIAVPRDRSQADVSTQILASTGLSELRAAQTETMETLALELPAFSLDARTELSTVLGTSAFQALVSPGADLAGLTGSPIKLSGILHAASLTVDETGAEARSETVISAVPTSGSSPTVTVRADHPFLFMVEHQETGLPVVAAHVTDPMKP